MLNQPVSGQMSRRDYRVLVSAFVAAVAVAWLVEPGAQRVIVFTYIAASFAYAFRLDVRGAPTWVLVGHGVASLLPLFVWRSGVPVAVALTAGVLVHAAVVVRRRSESS